jgi:hypothetical protein
MRGRAELSIILQVREQAFNAGRSSDSHFRISSISSGGSRSHPLAHSAVGEVRRSLRCNLTGTSFFQHGDANPTIITAAQRRKKTVRASAGDSPKVSLSLIRGGCWWSFRESDCRGSPPLHAWHPGVQTLAGTSPRGVPRVFQEREFGQGIYPRFPLIDAM